MHYHRRRFGRAHALMGLAVAWVSALGLPMPANAVTHPASVPELLAASLPQDWRLPDPENTLYLQLPNGRVAIELAPGLAPRHVANIKALARAHYYDGAAIVRVQDNYVVQWSDPDHRPLPPGVTMVAPELTEDWSANGRFEPLAARDAYAPEVGFIDGFPAARDRRSRTLWLVHCYGMVGVGRDEPPESDGSEMYAVIGHAPRHLDRNVALVGRVLMGVELLSSLSRGSGDMGFYVSSQSPTPITSVRVAADLPVPERTPLEVLRTDSATFRAIIDNRRNRRESWFKFNPAAIELCNVPLPVRRPAPAAN